MFAIPRRYSHFIFGVIQSGLTPFIAAIEKGSSAKAGDVVTRLSAVELTAQAD
ncbi:hypothetical protein QA640_47415 (plasmid) [Bradyrhizobium sp. CB82]|uniref:hypothetical protein n=1 Tax=Bradyrhizobium sp. CB82 TaxID=3039159 RepID=UPI0024B1E37A|nr:hypothetical protein [Bradyrhizobium sp. CB82]WFU45619.1 hypothetical protein QA640_47415 [Bradyrhizobium sp. CB82]